VSPGESDLGLNFIGAQAGDLEFAALFEERFVMACRRDHALARPAEVRWSELSKYVYITVGKASGNRILISQAMSVVKGPPQTMYETQQVTTAIGLLEAGLGIAAVPAMEMPTDKHPVLVGVALNQPVVSRKMRLIRRRSTVLSATAQKMYDLCTEFQPKS
jgi:DNA-binding transcriptional LysR family regulator